MTHPLISVIVPVFNTEQYLRQCVDSIINQTYTNLEIFLVDDGSTDNCPAICDDYANRDSRIRVIHKKNEGQSVARNMALDISRGEYIAFVDSDDWLEPTAYEEMMSFAQAEQLDAVYCVPNEITDGEVTGTRYHYYSDETVVDAKEILARTLCNEISAEPWLKLCHRKCWEGLRFPEGRIYEDVAIAFYPLVKAERAVGFLDRALYNYRINQSGTTQSRKPTARYHFYLALRERYEYALQHVPAAVEVARNLAARFAMGVYLDYKCNGWEELAIYQPEIEHFLNEEKPSLLSSTVMPKSQRLPLRLYYACKPLFTFAYKLALPVLRRRW